MRAPFFSLAALATLLLAGSVAPDADAADSPPSCSYGGLPYGNGAVICVAPKFGQKCDDKGKWGDPMNEHPFDTLCARAPDSVPGVPPIQCTYHDVKYSPGAKICVAPKFEQTCRTDGGWDSVASVDACTNAQIPTPTGAAPPSPPSKNGS
jgi:hypothetical protein